VQFVPNHPLLQLHVSGKEQKPFTQVCTHKGVAQVDDKDEANVAVVVIVKTGSMIVVTI
tara:strand:+ start:152 stop:328 length:177 start_codon:yes stop_codon:yes gene_type:complete